LESLREKRNNTVTGGGGRGSRWNKGCDWSRTAHRKEGTLGNRREGYECERHGERKKKKKKRGGDRFKKKKTKKNAGAHFAQSAGVSSFQKKRKSYGLIGPLRGRRGKAGKIERGKNQKSRKQKSSKIAWGVR